MPVQATLIELCDAAGFSLTTPVVDPLRRLVVMRRIPIDKVTVVTGTDKLVLLVNGPVASGAVLRLQQQALAVDGIGVLAGDIVLPGISPAEATFWFKALEPSLEGQDHAPTNGDAPGSLICARSCTNSGMGCPPRLISTFQKRSGKKQPGLRKRRGRF